MGKQVSDLVSEDTKVLNDGTALGTLYNTSGYEEFSNNPAEQSGHYFPVKLGETYKGKPITVKGRTGGDRAVTLDEDCMLIIRKENLSGNTAKIESDGEAVITLDFSKTSTGVKTP